MSAHEYLAFLITIEVVHFALTKVILQRVSHKYPMVASFMHTIDIIKI